MSITAWLREVWDAAKRSCVRRREHLNCIAGTLCPKCNKYGLFSEPYNRYMCQSCGAMFDRNMNLLKQYETIGR